MKHFSESDAALRVQPAEMVTLINDDKPVVAGNAQVLEELPTLSLDAISLSRAGNGTLFKSFSAKALNTPGTFDS